MQDLPKEYIDRAEKHLRDILKLAILQTPEQKAMVVSDTLSPLSRILKEAYLRCLPEARFLDFYSLTPEEVLANIQGLNPSDLVVLIQSTNFRLDAFRIRVELFKQALKVIEHPHLERMQGIETSYYIDALAYDPDYYRKIGKGLKALIDQAGRAIVDSDGEELIFEGGLESAKLNIGDYSEMKNVGGQFPIGEVFTEAKDLEAVNGRVRIFVFGDRSYSVNKVEKPITLVIEKGRVIEALDSTEEFDNVLANIRADEGEVWLRELGFGMNRALTPERTVCDIGTYERMCGIHLSLGAKHGIYNKPNFKRADTWHHVDVFAVTKGVYLDNQCVYQDGRWVI